MFDARSDAVPAANGNASDPKKAMITPKNLPAPSIRRLPSYLRLLEAAKARGERVVSCTRIAEELGRLSVQVRKDLAVTGVAGRPKVGYRVDELIEAIQAFLGWNRKTNAFLVGCGNLGSAILNYDGFAARGLNIVGVFDSNPTIVGKKIKGRKVFAFDDMLDCAKALKSLYGVEIEMGVITVPARAAQTVANSLIKVGVRAIWNYAPAVLELPEGVVCENVKLSESFAVLTNKMRNVYREEEEE
ncbi:MAG: redox-sensing transcriptional repressor Rex [Thermoguttaceae bacterium]|nr:redox-sensing transcriptional repressor Rex [Thermoguttaceae bacterium]